MKEISIYSKKDCPNCDMLKQLLKKDNIPYKIVNIFTPEAMTELAMNNVITRSDPVLQIDNKFYTTIELCVQDIIDQNMVKDIIKKEIE